MYRVWSIVSATGGGMQESQIFFVYASRQTDGYTAQSANTVQTVMNELTRQAIKN